MNCAHHPGDFCPFCAERAEDAARLAERDRRRAEDAANRYADTMTRRDVAARHTGRAEHDTDTYGRPLK